jgi:hypothetical protein
MDGHDHFETQLPVAAQEGIGDHTRLEAHVSIVSDPLHHLLGHYARLLWDIQKTRIQINNRLKALERDNIPPVHHMAALAVFEAQERAINRELEEMAKQHIMADWVEVCPGLGYGGFARIVGVTGDFMRFPTVSKVWKYMGLHVQNGHAPKRERGVTFTRTNGDVKGNAYNPQGRVVAHQIGESIVRLNRGCYRDMYDRMKAKYEAERLDWTQGRRHNAAMRYAVKMLIKDMWVEWRRRANYRVKTDSTLPATALGSD